jgi:alpha-glucosidase (family GH31 glycosyl hydrolase)
VHPFVLVQAAKDGRDEYLGIWFRNANAQSPIVAHNADGTSTLRYITTGGQLHAYFFMQGSAKRTISHFLDYAGRPRLPPLWAFGWHASSSAYDNLEKVEENVIAYAEGPVPLDGVWLDSSYMAPGKDFSVDTEGLFADLGAAIDGWHAVGLKVVPVLKASLTDDRESKYIAKLDDAEAAIAENVEGFVPLKQRVGAQEEEVFYDFFNEATLGIWAEGLGDLYDQLKFDGLWLDGNEPMASCNGNSSDSSAQCQAPLNWATPKSRNLEADFDTSWYKSWTDQIDKGESTYYLPFVPSREWNFDNMTLALNGTHKSTGFSEYDTHSLYGHMQSKATSEALDTAADARLEPFMRKLAFIASRSTFTGTGQFASHYTGDLKRNWEDMRHSIAQIMNFNMFGMAHTGANVCGNLESDLDEEEQQEVCGRWMQLATFYPFARQHLDEAGKWEPYNLRNDSARGDFRKMAESSIRERYKYVELMYQCMFTASQKLGDLQWEQTQGIDSTCFQPLFFDFPDVIDHQSEQNDFESTFVAANSIKVSPVLQKKVGDTYDVFFPKGTWVDLTTF